MQQNKYIELITQLENEELESVSISVEIYFQLIAAYMYRGRLTDVKILWWRIPPALRTENKELNQLQLLCQSLVNNNYADFYKHIKFDWSDCIKHIMEDLHIKIRTDLMHLIGAAYTSIYEKNLLNMTQLTTDELKTSCAALNWGYETDGQQSLVKPKPTQTKPYTSIENQLLKLTKVVSFLEN